MNGRWWLAVILLVPLAACTSSEAAPEPTPALSTPARSVPTVSAGPATVTVPLGDRPFRLYVPRSYRSTRPVPLVVGLHGYTSNSARLESYLQLAAQAERRGFLYALPDGTVDQAGDQFWNATFACCDLYRTGVDDSGYLSRLIETVKRFYAVDAKRVYLFGHSNGGYMSHRMACEHADQITAIASLAGVVWKDPSLCNPVRPITILQIHGTADEIVAYEGAAYPGAEETVGKWRSKNGCSDRPDSPVPAQDFDDRVAGAETTILDYPGCRDGTRVELWRMEGSLHSPAITAAFTPAVIDFLYRFSR